MFTFLPYECTVYNYKKLLYSPSCEYAWINAHEEVLSAKLNLHYSQIAQCLKTISSMSIDEVLEHFQFVTSDVAANLKIRATGAHRELKGIISNFLNLLSSSQI